MQRGNENYDFSFILPENNRIKDVQCCMTVDCIHGCGLDGGAGGALRIGAWEPRDEARCGAVLASPDVCSYAGVSSAASNPGHHPGHHGQVHM